MDKKEKTTPEVEELKASSTVEKKAKKLPLGALIAIIVAGVIVLAAAGFFGFAFLQDSGAKNAYNAKDYKTAYDKAQTAFFMDDASKIMIEKAYIEEVLIKAEKKYFTAAKMINDSKMTAEEKAKLFADHKEIAAYQVGQIITFGKYDQNNNLQDEFEDIEWIVVKVEEGNGHAYATLLSKKILDNPGGWNKIEGNASYANSNIHEWCNGTFLNGMRKYMSAEEEEKIVTVNVKTGEETVQTKVYVPSKKEIEEYLQGDLAKYIKAEVTDTAKNAGVLRKGTEKTGSYYVRDAGEKEKSTQWAAGFDYEGKYNTGLPSTSGQTGARVCITIDLGPVA